MSPKARLTRELRRLSYQLRLHVPRDIYYRLRDDGRSWSTWEQYQAALEPKIAVYLLYQPAGIRESTCDAVRFLAGGGYSVILVSNTPVSERDRQRLKEDAAGLLVRRNFGYDFGGYKEALRLLWDQQREPAELMLLNDSIYFPVFEDSDILARLSSATSLFCGPMFDGAASHTFLGSYMLHFKGDLISSSSFKSFWQGYRASSNKRDAIRQGEIGISSRMGRDGFAPDALYTPSALLDALSPLSAAETLKACQSVIASRRKPVGKELRQAIEAYVDRPDWQKGALAALKRELDRRNDSLAAMALYPTYLGMPVIKAPPVHNSSYRRQVLAALKPVRHRMTDSIAHEIFGPEESSTRR